VIFMCLFLSFTCVAALYTHTHVPPQSLHPLLSRLCSQMEAPLLRFSTQAIFSILLSQS
jgi:hypothetical protein